jgi:hypothetical protein
MLNPKYCTGCIHSSCDSEKWECGSDDTERIVSDGKCTGFTGMAPPNGIDVDLLKLSRNGLGHLDDCNYFDWPDFSKCECAKGLAGIPEQATHVQVAPMPLRDWLAGAIDIPFDRAVEHAEHRLKDQQRLLATQTQGVTMQLAMSALAELRYMAADMMILYRANGPSYLEPEQEPAEE